MKLSVHHRLPSVLALITCSMVSLASGPHTGATQADSTYNKMFEKQKKVADGLFRMHLSDGKVYMDIPRKLFGRDMLLGSTISATSDNKNGVTGSKPEDPLHFVFTEEENHVAMRLVSEEDSDLNAIFKLFKNRQFFFGK